MTLPSADDAADDADNDAPTESELRLWHALGADDGECECPDCAELEARDLGRARLIARLKGRLLSLGGQLDEDDEFASIEMAEAFSAVLA